MTAERQQHQETVKDFTRLPLWRVIVLGSISVIAFNLFWLVPALDDIKRRVMSHQLEVAERVEGELERIVIDHPQNKADELALFLLPKLKNAAVFDALAEQDLSSFFENRDDVLEFSVIGADGFERAKVSRTGVVPREELRNVVGADYVRQAFKQGFSVGAFHEEMGRGASAVVAARRIIVPEVGAVVLSVKVDLSLLEKFAFHLAQDEKELVYVVDDQGVVIDHYRASHIGTSAFEHRFIKDLYGDLDTEEEDHYRAGAYIDQDGEKLQATALLFHTLRFTVVVEEPYREIWSSWNRFLLFILLSIIFFITLVILLTINTLRMFAVSNQLSEAKEKVESVVSSLDTGIIEHDQNFKITLVNPRAEKMLNISKEDVLGKTITSDALNNTPHLKSLVYVLYPAVCETAKKVQHNKEEGGYGVVEIQLADPVEQDLQVTTIPLYDVRQNVKSYLKEIRDVSREKAIAKSKSEFISVAAHQLRTPLSAVKWVFKMLLDGDAGPVNPEQKDFLQKGYDSNERIIQLVSDMLDAARIEEGRFGFEFYLANLTDVVQKSIDMFQMKAKEKNIALSFEKPNKLDLIKLDPTRIELAVQNLIDNALKYTPKNGSVSVTIVPAGNYVKVGVHDTGIGVPKDQADKLFSKFFRGTNAVKFETEGTGLGLFIVKNIIVRHGGTIWAEANEKGGTTFYFLLPKEEKIIPGKNQSFEEFVEGL